MEPTAPKGNTFNLRRFMPPSMELLTFEAVARHGSFTLAANELNLTQSTISKQIRSLEDMLGFALFERGRKRVAITVEGANYLDEIRGALRRISMSTHAAMSSGGRQEVVRLAVNPTFAMGWLLDASRAYMDANQGMTVHFSTRVRRFNFEDEPFDIAIQCGTEDWPQASTRYLFHEHLVAVASPGHLAGLNLRKPGDLAGAVLIRQVSRAQDWDEWLVRAGVTDRRFGGGPVFDQIDMIREAAVCGMGIALVPKFSVLDQLASGRLAEVFAGVRLIARPYFLVSPHNARKSRHIAALCRWLEARADQAEGAHRQPAS
ncbi:MAG: LysR substrate-binding domain-containing protein [Microbacterium sp.]